MHVHLKSVSSVEDQSKLVQCNSANIWKLEVSIHIININVYNSSIFDFTIISTDVIGPLPKIRTQHFHGNCLITSGRCGDPIKLDGCMYTYVCFSPAFYAVENITGYTGPPFRLVVVYFSEANNR